MSSQRSYTTNDLIIFPLYRRNKEASKYLFTLEKNHQMRYKTHMLGADQSIEFIFTRERNEAWNNLNWIAGIQMELRCDALKGHVKQDKLYVTQWFRTQNFRKIAEIKCREIRAPQKREILKRVAKISCNKVVFFHWHMYYIVMYPVASANHPKNNRTQMVS